jgi:hypothetical protein
LTKEEKGFNVFGLSVMDGYHSVTMILDTSNTPVVYWNDQHESWKKMDKVALDKKIEDSTKKCWNKLLKEKDTKSKTRVTVWRYGNV